MERALRQDELDYPRRQNITKQQKEKDWVDQGAYRINGRGRRNKVSRKWQDFESTVP